MIIIFIYSSIELTIECAEAVLQRCSYKKLFWKYAVNLQENTHAEAQCNFIEIALWHGCSPVNLLHIFRTPFLKNSSGGLLLNVGKENKKSLRIWGKGTDKSLRFVRTVVPRWQENNKLFLKSMWGKIWSFYFSFFTKLILN